VIHRDFKPSNCVRVRTFSGTKKFVLDDFGLLRSFVITEDSSIAVPSHPWTKSWTGLLGGVGSSLLQKADFILGGLPWIISAKHREREACQVLKEEIHGNGHAPGCELLFGPAYYEVFLKNITEIDIMPHLQADWLYALSDLIYSTRDVTKLEKWDASWCASHGYRR
jgi:hypothetical protein